MSTAPSTRGVANKPNEAIDLKTLIDLLVAGKWAVLLCTLLMILLGAYYAFSVATPIYPARATMALESQQSQVVNIESVLSSGVGGSEDLNTEIEVIKSRIILERLVDNLRLQDDPEFNTLLQAPNKLNPIYWLKAMLRTPSVPTEEEIKDAVVDTVLSIISVSNIRQSYVFHIDVKTTNPVKSALIANTLAEIYIDDTLDKKRVATQRASEWLSEKAVELKAELEDSERAVTNFKDRIQVVSAEALDGLSRQLKDLRIRLDDVTARYEAAQIRISAIKAGLEANDLSQVAVIADDPELSRLQSAGDEQGFQARIAAILLQSETELQRTKEQAAGLQKSEQKFRQNLETQSDDFVQLQQLTREAEANGLLFQNFLTRLKEASIQKGLQQPDSRLLSKAIPRNASSPRKKLILIFSTLFGLLMGAGFVLLRELRSSAFKSTDELEAFTGKNVLGGIPRIKTSSRLGLLKYAIEKPTSAFSESIRNLRTSILMANVDSQPKVIMSTSSVPGEGKTSQSLTLAQNMAGLGKKVLVIEGDMRKQVFSEYFSLPPRPGFLSVMSGDVKLEDAVYFHDTMGVDLLFAEKSATNAADIFSSKSFEDLIVMLRENYDFIIIDTAPVLAVSDARIIGRHVDAIMYAVLWNSTTKAQVKDGLEMFASVDLDVTGLVLTNIDEAHLRKHGKPGSYSYASYYDN